jgi:catecholate siderophore receptor
MGTPTRVTLDWYHLSRRAADEGIPYTRAGSLAQLVTVAPLGTDAFATANGQTVTRSRDTFYGLANRDFRRTLTDAATVRVAHDLGGVSSSPTRRAIRM